jgi:uncharacterized protein (DUF1501 family)
MAKKAKTRNRLPKRVAGVKVPKALRRGRLGRLLASPVGQAIIIESVVRTGEHMLSRGSSTGSALRGVVDRSGAAASDLGGQAAEQSSQVVYAMRQAARAFIDAMQEDRQARVQAELEPSGVGGGRKDGGLEKKESKVEPRPHTAH